MTRTELRVHVERVVLHDGIDPTSPEALAAAINTALGDALGGAAPEPSAVPTAVPTQIGRAVAPAVLSAGGMGLAGPKEGGRP